MKKLMTMLLGLSLAMGVVAMAAPQTTKSTKAKSTKAKSTKKATPKKATKA